MYSQRTQGFSLTVDSSSGIMYLCLAKGLIIKRKIGQNRHHPQMYNVPLLPLAFKVMKAQAGKQLLCKARKLL